MVGYITEALFLYKTYASARGLPQKNVFEVLPTANVETIQLANLNESRPLSCATMRFSYVASYTADIVNLCLLCKALNPEVIFEIGTLQGDSAFHLALNSREAARIYSLDLPKDRPFTSTLKTTLIDSAMIRAHDAVKRYCFEGTPAERKITCLFGDSATFDFRPFEKQVDLFIIDGAHSYEYVRSDTLNALKCCHPGSVIVWDDFGRMGVNGVSKWLLELSRTHRIYTPPGGSLAFTVVD
jgi:predicted O-methyltransferase YrrM